MSYHFNRLSKVRPTLCPFQYWVDVFFCLWVPKLNKSREKRVTTTSSLGKPNFSFLVDGMPHNFGSISLEAHLYPLAHIIGTLKPSHLSHPTSNNPFPSLCLAALRESFLRISPYIRHAYVCRSNYVHNLHVCHTLFPTLFHSYCRNDTILHTVVPFVLSTILYIESYNIVI